MNILKRTAARAVSLAAALAMTISFLPADLLTAADEFPLPSMTASADADITLKGDGTQSQPYEISTAQELAKMRDLVNSDDESYRKAYYVLTADINLEDLKLKELKDGKGYTGWKPIGRSDKSMSAIRFEGTFDGAGHTISGLYISMTSYGRDNYRGLFGLNEGTIKNLAVEGDIEKAGFGVALIAGVNDGTIENCYASGSVYALMAGGGIAGYNSAENSILRNCYSEVTGKGNSVGAVVGYLPSPTETRYAENCYYTSNVNGHMGTADNNESIIKVSDTDLASGKIAWLLQNGAGGETAVWGQEIGKDGKPVLLTEDEQDKKVCKITYNLGEQTIGESYVNVNNKITVPEFAQSPDGYTAGSKWYKDIAQQTEWNIESETVTEDTTLYSERTLEKYTATLDLNGGELSEEDKAVWADNKLEFTVDSEIKLPHPTKKGCEFVGWTSDDDDHIIGDAQYDVTIEKGSQGDRTYVAQYRDATAPDVSIHINEHKWDYFDETPSADLFYNTDQQVTITAKDDQDETVDEIWYYISKDALSLDEVKALAESKWTEYKEPFTVTAPSPDTIIYARVRDDAGNYNYICTSDIVIEITPPAISGAGEGAQYCVSVQLNVSDIAIDHATDNGQPILSDQEIKAAEEEDDDLTVMAAKVNDVRTYTISGAGEHNFVVYDKAGNSSNITVNILGEHQRVIRIREYIRYPDCDDQGFYHIHKRCLTCSQEIGVEEYYEPAKGHSFGEWKTVVSPDCTSSSGQRQRECKVCKYVEVENFTEDGHKWADDYTIDKPATCTEAGSKSIHCLNCDAVKDSEIIPVLPHNLQPAVKENETAATCTADGRYDEVVRCADCGEVITSVSVTVPSPGHQWGEWSTVDAPSCTEQGMQQRVCDACGLTETAELDKSEHSWEEQPTIDKQPTCTEEGSKSIHCKNCDATKDSETIPANGHSGDEKVVEKNVLPTCTEEGSYEEVTYCKDCGAELSRVHFTVIRTDHDWNDWEDVSMPDCDDSGSQMRSCKVCGVSETRGVDPTGHKWADKATVDVEPTCTTEGSQSIKCTVCGIAEESEVIPALGHKWSDWKTVDMPDCDDDGTEERYCEVCSTTETRGLISSGHSWNEDYTIDKAADCTTDGSKSIHCSKCDAVDKSEVIPALGHTFGEWEEVKTADGKSNEQRKCTVCGYTETRGTDLENHKWNTEYTIDVEPTCTTEGSKSIHCSVCGFTKDSTVIPAKGHDWGEWKTISSPDCDDEGTQERECNVCHTKETNGLAANGHTWNEDYTIDKAADCTTDGSKSIHCSKCDAVDKSEVIPALGHTFGEWEEVKTADGKSNEQRKCTACGYTETRGTDLENHKWNTEYTIDVEPTCTTEGSKSIHCSVCGFTKESTVIPAKGHEWGEWKTISSPDCDDEGTQERECNVCHTKETNGLAANGHTWNEDYTIDKAADCTTDGSKSIHCSKCDAVKDSEVIPARGSHIPSERQNVKEATPTADGYTGDIFCTECGELLEKGEVIPATRGSLEIVPEIGESAPDILLTEEEKAALEDAVLSEEDKAARDDGANISIVLSVEIADSVSKDDKELTENAIAGNYELGEYLELDLKKYIDENEFVITQLSKPITITIAVPDALKADNRQFAVVRLHDGKADLLADTDSDTATITFETDRFSVYAIVYADAQEVTPPPADTDTPTEPDKPTDTDTPTEPDNPADTDTPDDTQKPDDQEQPAEKPEDNAPDTGKGTSTAAALAAGIAMCAAAMKLRKRK